MIPSERQHIPFSSSHLQSHQSANQWLEILCDYTFFLFSDGYLFWKKERPSVTKYMFISSVNIGTPYRNTSFRLLRSGDRIPLALGGGDPERAGGQADGGSLCLSVCVSGGRWLGGGRGTLLRRAREPPAGPRAAADPIRSLTRRARRLPSPACRR